MPRSSAVGESCRRDNLHQPVPALQFQSTLPAQAPSATPHLAGLEMSAAREVVLPGTALQASPAGTHSGCLLSPCVCSALPPQPEWCQRTLLAKVPQDPIASLPAIHTRAETPSQSPTPSR